MHPYRRLIIKAIRFKAVFYTRVLHTLKEGLILSRDVGGGGGGKVGGAAFHTRLRVKGVMQKSLCQ